MYDMFGYPIQLGDTIAYAPTGRIDSWDSVKYGVVKEIKQDKIKVGAMVKFRNPKYCINISYLRPLEEVRNESPELFI